MNHTEFLFGVLILGCYYFSLGKKNPHYVISGVLLGFAFGVRQVAVALYLSYLSLYLFGLIRRNADHRKMALLTLGAVGTVLCIGFFTKNNLGHFVVTSTTGPVNMIMGANDDATGTYNAAVFKKGNTGHIEKEGSKTYIEKGEFWKSQSLKWVKENPLRWILLFPRKLFFTFVWDDWSVFTLLNSNRWNLYVIGKLAIKEKRPEEIFRGERMTFVAGFILLYVVHHLYYYLILFLLFYQFYYYWKNNRRDLLRKFSAIYLFSFWGIGATLMGVGLARYKYPYVIILMTTIAPMLLDIVKGKGSKRSRNSLTSPTPSQ